MNGRRGALICALGELLHFHPHFHVLLTCVTCGAFTAEGEFLELPELDMDRLREAWREAVFALYLAEEKLFVGRSRAGSLCAQFPTRPPCGADRGVVGGEAAMAASPPATP